jgi:hypothetical protein
MTTVVNQQIRNNLIDYYLTEELINNLPIGYASRVQTYVARHVELPDRKIIYARAKAILNGQEALAPSADIDGKPSTRIGKDRCYEGFWTLIDIMFPNKEERYYIGLSSNQLSLVKDKINNDIVVIENRYRKAQQLKRLALFINTLYGPKIKVLNMNIFTHLRSNKAKNKYNIFDLDLMCALPIEKEIYSWASSIWNAAHYKTNLIYIANSIGRNITEKEHDIRIEILNKALEEVGFKDIRYSRFAYRDRRIPIRGERIILTKLEEEKENVSKESSKEGK